MAWSNIIKSLLNNQNTTKKVDSYSYDSGVTHPFMALFGKSSPVSKEQAMSIPAVAAAHELICGAIAQMPIRKLRKDPTTDSYEEIDDEVVNLINDEPNDTMTGFDLKKKWASDYLLYGATYSKIERNLNEIMGIYPLDTKDITVVKYVTNGYKITYEIQLNNQSGRYEFIPYELFSCLRNSIDGVTSSGIIQDNQDILQEMLNSQQYSKSILENGSLPVGMLTTAGKLMKDSANHIRSQWNSLYSGVKNALKVVVLENGLEYKPISLNPDELQLKETQARQLSDVARIFNVPETMINVAANKYAANEQSDLYFLKYTLAPILMGIESSLNKFLLLEEEKSDGISFKFDTTALLQVTDKEKTANVVSKYNGGLISLDEARVKLGYPKIMKNDYFMFTTGSVLFDPNTNKMIIPNTMQTPSGQSQSVDLSENSQNDAKTVAKKDKLSDNSDSGSDHDGTKE